MYCCCCFCILGQNVVVEWLKLPLHVREVPGSNLDTEPAILTEMFRGFLQSLETNSEKVPKNYDMIVSFQILSNYSLIQSLIILTFDAI
jgi:hypothetical protein